MQTTGAAQETDTGMDLVYLVNVLAPEAILHQTRVMHLPATTPQRPLRIPRRLSGKEVRTSGRFPQLVALKSF